MGDHKGGAGRAGKGVRVSAGRTAQAASNERMLPDGTRWSFAGEQQEYQSYTKQVGGYTVRLDIGNEDTTLRRRTGRRVSLGVTRGTPQMVRVTAPQTTQQIARWALTAWRHHAQSAPEGTKWQVNNYAPGTDSLWRRLGFGAQDQAGRRFAIKRNGRVTPATLFDEE